MVIRIDLGILLISSDSKPLPETKLAKTYDEYDISGPFY